MNNFIFTKCSFIMMNELIREGVISTGWNVVQPDYIDGLEIISENDVELAIIYYNRNIILGKDMGLTIAKFEVFKKYRNQGFGTKIIKQFLSNHNENVQLLPLNEDACKFWIRCGFKGDKYELFYKK